MRPSSSQRGTVPVHLEEGMVGMLLGPCLHGDTSLNAISQLSALAQGVRQSVGTAHHLEQSRARQKMPGWEGPALCPDCSQRCPGSLGTPASRSDLPWGLRARRAPCSGGHGPSSTERYLRLHSASDPSGGRLAGREQDRGREGRERMSAMLVAPWGQESPPGPTNVCTQSCRCAHRPAHTHVHGDLHTHTHVLICTHGPTPTGTLHTHVQTQPLLMHPHTHVCTHTQRPCSYTYVHTHSPCTHISVHTEPAYSTPLAHGRASCTATHNATDACAALCQGTHRCQALLRQGLHTHAHACARTRPGQPCAQPWHSL